MTEDKFQIDETEALLLAGYLDGRLNEDAAARLESRLVAEPALLDEMLALRESLAAGSDAVPAAVVARAQALRPAGRGQAVAESSWRELLFGTWLRPAVPAFAVLTLLMAGVAAFELGRYQAEQLSGPQGAEVAEGDVPVDLLMDGLI